MDSEARALIGPTGYGTWGIQWHDFPEMEARGGYSGPFEDEASARQCVADWGAAYETPVTIKVVANVNEPVR